MLTQEHFTVEQAEAVARSWAGLEPGERQELLEGRFPRSMDGRTNQLQCPDA